MTAQNKASGFSLKAIYSTLAAALSFRHIDRDPNNRDVAIDHGGNDAESKPRMDHALQLSTVWACMRLISNAIAAMPLFVYERGEVGGRETRRVAREHPLYSILHDSPNADQTAFEFKRYLSWQLLGWGNFYAEIVRGPRGRIVSLEPLMASGMSVRRLENGSRQYTYQDGRGQTIYAEGDIWHLMGPSEDGLVGLSAIGVGWRSMERAANIGESGSRLFGGGMRPSGVVSVDPIFDPEQRKQMKAKLIEGTFNARAMGNMYLLEGGATYQQLTVNPIDAQMMEQMNASVEDICRWFGVPPAKIGHGTAVSNWGTGREQQNLGFLQEVLDPDLVMVEQSIVKWLIPRPERTTIFAEFARESLLRMDSKSRAEFYGKMIDKAVYTPNFCRGLENLEPVDGGDQLFMQSNMIPLNMVGKMTSTAQNDTIAQDTQGNDDELPDEIG